MPGFKRKMMMGLLLLALMSPLGIILPRMFNSGEAWGEWSADKVEKEKGYVPQGMQQEANRYKAPVTGYNIKEEDSIWKQSGSYIISAIIGIGAIGLITFGTIKLLPKK